MEFLMGFWQCQVAVPLFWVALQKRGETKLRDFLLYRANPMVERAKCFEFYLNT
jgi:hypothetical protein